MNELYNRIEALAIERGMSVWMLCQRSGVAAARLTALKKNANSKLNAANTKKLADTLGVSVDKLLFGDEEGARVFRVNLDRKLPDLKPIFAKFTERELVFFISEMTAELQRRKDEEE